jgi:hypothetical protein
MSFQFDPKGEVCMTTDNFKKVIMNQAICTQIKDEMLLTIRAANGENQ